MIEYDNKWVLDQHDIGYYMARWHSKTYPIGYDEQIAINIIEKLNLSHKPNLEVKGGSLYVCWNLHDNGSPCEYECLIENAF